MSAPPQQTTETRGMEPASDRTHDEEETPEIADVLHLLADDPRPAGHPAARWRNGRRCFGNLALGHIAGRAAKDVSGVAIRLLRTLQALRHMVKVGAARP